MHLNMKNEMNQDYLFKYRPMITVSQAAKYMGVGKKIIYQLIEFDEIRAVREHSRVLVEKKSLDEFRASGKLT
jgi:excisionase family DNA binding protein